MVRDYAFTGFVAEFWDLLGDPRTDWDDREFFAQLVTRYGEPILDVGCGTGRLLLDFVERGLDVDGLDVSPEMLDICEAKADALGVTIDVYEQPMEELDLPREYGTIIVASSAFQLIVDDALAARAMRRFAEHVRPGGVVAMSFAWLWDGEPAIEAPAQWSTVAQVTRDDGAVIRRSSKSWYDVAARLEHRQDRYEVIVDDEVVASELHERAPSAKGYTQAEVVALFHGAGFQHVELLDPWTMATIDHEQPLYVAVGQKA